MYIVSLYELQYVHDAIVYIEQFNKAFVIQSTPPHLITIQ